MKQHSRKFYLVVAVLVLGLDRLSKWLVSTRIEMHDTLKVIPGFFRFTHVENPGAAFGIFSESPSQWTLMLLIFFSIVALVVVSMLLWKNSHSMSSTGGGLALILGGAVGNLWDRLISGRVVDFLDFYLGSYHWPAFNLADSAIVIGALLLVGEIVFAKSAARETRAAQR